MQKTTRSRGQQARQLVLLACFVGSVSGCGYSVLGRTDGVTSTVRLLSIAPVNNQTREPDLERLMTLALWQTLLQHPLLAPTAEATVGHRLAGTIRRFRALALSFDDRDNVLQYRLEAEVQIRLVDGSRQALVFEQEIAAATEYLVSREATSNVREDVVARQAALVRLAQQIADKCLALLTIALL